MGELDGRPDRAQEEALPGGAVLLLHTDGLSEARDERGVFFDPVRQLSGRVFTGPDELLDELVDDVHRYTGGRSTDDMALLAVRRP
jgi:serine phosphatase RsbU (regulator of sigma subunit)